LDRLGAPANLYKVQVQLLWEARYRVNVFTGNDAASARIAHSFFIAVDDEGHVLQSTPGITKQY